jgi:hypothetical protein
MVSRLLLFNHAVNSAARITVEPESFDQQLAILKVKPGLWKGDVKSDLDWKSLGFHSVRLNERICLSHRGISLKKVSLLAIECAARDSQNLM